jgi:hypothetical protein
LIAALFLVALTGCRDGNGSSSAVTNVKQSSDQSKSKDPANKEFLDSKDESGQIGSKKAKNFTSVINVPPAPEKPNGR